MVDNTLKHFLFEYVRSLKERTRLEKSGFKNGLDWLICQLGIQKGWVLVRAPFSVENNKEPKAKNEGEFGIDASFLSHDRTVLYLFVLKDERLINKNWTKESFDTDIKNASSPNMKEEGLEKVKTVKIITAYNKDDDKNGIELYERLTKSFSKQFGPTNEYERKYERWDISKIVEEVGSCLLTPDLLPNQVASQFRYICSQINDFDFCSRQWLDQLEPNWKNFVESVLGDEINGNKINLLALALYILKDSWKSEKESYVGWIDLVEWAMLALWRHHYKLEDSKRDKIIKGQIFSVWARVYLVELELYFNAVDPVLRTQHGLSLGNLSFDMSLIPINDAYRAYWHMGRLGLLSLALQDMNFGADHKEIISERLIKISESLLYLLQSNPATLRPLIDLHHIELFLVWTILHQVGRQNDINVWLIELEEYLTIRRFSNSVNLPFIQSNNDLDSLVDHVIRGEKQGESEISSSHLILMLMELCFSVKDSKKRDELLELYMQSLAKGIDGNGEHFEKKDDNIKQRIDLLSWSPPEDWEEKLINGPIGMEGVAVTTGNFERFDDSPPKPLSERIELFVNSMRSKYPQSPPQKLPYSVCILACIKHKSPLPPEFWRGTVFPQDDKV